MTDKTSSVKNKSPIFWGLIMIALGVIFLFDELNIMDAGDFFSTFWPLILVAIGVKLIMNKGSNATVVGDDKEPLVDSSKQVKYSKGLGDINLKLDTQEFEGGNVNTTIGDINVDLTEMTVASGEKTLTINGVIGDISVKLPKTLKVTIKANVVIGDIHAQDITGSGFFLSRTYRSEGYENAKKKLYLVVSQVIGDIEVRSA